MFKQKISETGRKNTFGSFSVVDPVDPGSSSDGAALLFAGQVARSPGRQVAVWISDSAAPRRPGVVHNLCTWLHLVNRGLVWPRGQGCRDRFVENSTREWNDWKGVSLLTVDVSSKKIKKNKTRSAVMMCSAVQRSLITCAYMIIHVLIKSHLGKFTSCLFCLPARE